MKITIYTTNTCAYCAMVKRYLDSKNMAYETVNLDEYPERQQEAYKLSGALTVPITVIDSVPGPKTVIGWNPAKLAAAIS